MELSINMNYSAFSNSLMKKVHVIFTCISVISFPCCLCVLCLIFRVMFCHEAEEPVTRFRFFHEEPLVILMLIKMSFCLLMKSVMMRRCDAHIWIQRNKNTEKLMLFLFINDNLLIHSCKTIINSSFIFF